MFHIIYYAVGQMRIAIALGHFRDKKAIKFISLIAQYLSMKHKRVNERMMLDLYNPDLRPRLRQWILLAGPRFCVICFDIIYDDNLIEFPKPTANEP